MTQVSLRFVILPTLVLTSIGASSVARAQVGAPVPAIPGGAGPAASGLSSAAGLAAPAAAAPRTIWSSLGLSAANIHACRDKLCASQLGQMMNSMMVPLGAYTGGVIPTICPPVPNPAGLADQAAQTGGPAGPAGAQAAAAAIQADVAGAGARIAAIEYLATVDCHYWPEAEAALIGRLRGDRVECVRFAAARALGSGCCCTKKTIEALQLVLAGEDKDGFPSETSERVRAAAAVAIENCLTRLDGIQAAPETPVPPEPPEPALPTPPEPPSPGNARAFGPRASQRPRLALEYYETTIAKRSFGKIKADARRTLAMARSQGVGTRIMTTGNRSLYGALARASTPLDRPNAADRPSAADRPNANGPAINLEHEETGQPVRPAMNQPHQAEQASAGVPLDAAVARADGPERATHRPQRSVFDLLRRSFRSRPAAEAAE
jgi:hypothetical protein